MAHGLNNCGSRALEHKLCRMRELPKRAIEFVSPALAGAFLTTEPPGSPSTNYIFKSIKESIKIRAEINATEDKLQQKID